MSGPKQVWARARETFMSAGPCRRDIVTDATKRIEMAIERIRPAMQMDGGDLRLVEWDAAQGIARVELTGACAGCDRSTATMSLGVERVLKQLVPEVRAVLTV